MKKILVVDDDQKITAALRIRLQHAGFSVHSATDGLSGLREAVAQKPDLVLMDIMMPQGMGFSVAERFKALGLAHVPVIFITASKRSGLRKTAEHLGAAGFFEKPYNADELLSAVSLLLSAQETQVPHRVPAAPGSQ